MSLPTWHGHVDYVSLYIVNTTPRNQGAPIDFGGPGFNFPYSNVMYHLYINECQHLCETYIQILEKIHLGFEISYIVL